MNEIIIIWQFEVQPALREEFERAYSPDGDWAQLFRCSPDYLGTQLLHDTANPGRYLTLDRWRSAAAFDTFKQDHHADYDALDQGFEALAISETYMGTFERMYSPDH